MKLVIDTTAKTVKLEDSANVSELVDALKKMFPDDWKSYKIEQTVSIQYYPVYPQKQYPYYPFSPIYCGTSVLAANANTGVAFTWN